MTASADTIKAALTEWLGQPIHETAIEFSGNIAAGLGSSGVAADEPTLVEYGGRRYVVLEVVGAKHRHEPIDKDDPGGPLRLINVLKCETALFVEPEVVSDVVAAHKKVEAAKEAQRKLESGEGLQQSLDDGGDPPPPPPAPTSIKGRAAKKKAQATAKKATAKKKAATKGTSKT